MKKIWFLLLISLMINEYRAQVLCDSTLMVCDSVSIDSVIISQINNFDAFMFELTVSHYFLYAPTFELCMSSDSVQFVDTSMGFTGIFGPSTIALHYVFQDFNFSIGDEIAGAIVVDNSNNSIDHCQIPFSITVNELTLIEESHVENSVEIFPNPANDLLVVQLQNENEDILNIQLFNLAGIRQSTFFFENTIDVSGIIPGYYTVHIELSNGKRIIQKIIKE